MKKIKKINLSKMNFEQNEVLQKSELKNIHGGHGYSGTGSGGSFYCIHEYSGGIRETPCFMELSTAVAFCQFYSSTGYACRCYAC